jgi:hypothetical protein
LNFLLALHRKSMLRSDYMGTRARTRFGLGSRFVLNNHYLDSENLEYFFEILFEKISEGYLSFLAYLISSIDFIYTGIYSD